MCMGDSDWWDLNHHTSHCTIFVIIYTGCFTLSSIQYRRLVFSNYVARLGPNKGCY